MKKLSKTIVFMLLLVAAVMFFPATRHSANAAANGFVKVGNQTYYYNNGVKHVGWLKLNGNYYYFRKDGTQVKGWVYLNGKKYRYFTSGGGVMLTGFVQNGNNTYHFKSNGVLSYGWIQENGESYYASQLNGLLLKGWVKNPSGYMRYFASNTGKMFKGWIRCGDYKRYFEPKNGFMYTGYKIINNTLYAFNANGLAYTNRVVNYGGKTYYLDKDGAGIDLEVLKNEILNETGITSNRLVNLGEYKITFYCPCTECSGGYGNQTSTGTIAKPNHTIAVDPKVIPYGSAVLINGVVYVAEDCGGGVNGKHIDIYVSKHSETLRPPFTKANVYLIK